MSLPFCLQSCVGSLVHDVLCTVPTSCKCGCCFGRTRRIANGCSHLQGSARQPRSVCCVLCAVPVRSAVSLMLRSFLYIDAMLFKVEANDARFSVMYYVLAVQVTHGMTRVDVKSAKAFETLTQTPAVSLEL